MALFLNTSGGAWDNAKKYVGASSRGLALGVCHQPWHEVVLQFGTSQQQMAAQEIHTPNYAVLHLVSGAAASYCVRPCLAGPCLRTDKSSRPMCVRRLSLVRMAARAQIHTRLRLPAIQVSLLVVHSCNVERIVGWGSACSDVAVGREPCCVYKCCRPRSST